MKILQFIINSTLKRCLVKYYRGSIHLDTSYLGSHPNFMLRALKQKVSFCLLADNAGIFSQTFL